VVLERLPRGHGDGLGGSKPQLLAEALQGGTKIITIITNQTLPDALDLIQSQASDH
jgi:type I restriction enzyme R subunit